MCRLNILMLLFVPSLRLTKAAQGWDYMLFSQVWPKTICRTWLDENSMDTCRVQDVWTIHGIWPTMSGTTGPEFCNQTWLYDPEEVQSLKSELEQSWPNILKDSPNDFLWAHEWNKHGTCATDVKLFNSIKNYFSVGMELLQKYTMNTILSEANIAPSNSKTYTPTEIYNAIKSKTGVNPEIKCTRIEGKQYLWELRLCFSRSVELIDCKNKNFVRDFYENDGIISNCDLSGIIYL